MEDVIIIGGGISGLTAAWRLKQAGVRALVLEASERAGGNLRSERLGDYLIEQGPHSFLPFHDEVFALVEELKLNDAVISATSLSQTRWIWREGSLRALPMSPKAFLTSSILSFPAKLRLAIEPFIAGRASEEDTAKAFFERRLGKEATKWMIAPFVSGVYAGDPERLGAKDAFFKMWSWEHEKGSMILGARAYMKKKRAANPDRPKRKGMFSFEEGLRKLPDTIVAALDEGQVETSAPVARLEKEEDHWIVQTERAIHRANHVILACPPLKAAKIVKEINPKMRDIFKEIEMAAVSVVHVGIGENEARIIPDGFGFLVPRRQGIHMLGCIFQSKLYPKRAPAGTELLTIYTGGAFDEEAVVRDDETLLDEAMQDLNTILGLEEKPVFHKILRHTQAIPQLTIGHKKRVAALKGYADSMGGLSLAGNYLEGVGLNDAVMSGMQAAMQIRRGARKR